MAKLKFRGDLPWNLEKKLAKEYNFRFCQREPGSFVIYEKRPADVLDVNGHLPEGTQVELTRKMNMIVDNYLHPEVHQKVIRNRILLLRAYHTPAQQKFIDDWMAENLEDV